MKNFESGNDNYEAGKEINETTAQKFGEKLNHIFGFIARQEAVGAQITTEAPSTETATPAAETTTYSSEVPTTPAAETTTYSSEQYTAPTETTSTPSVSPDILTTTTEVTEVQPDQASTENPVTIETVES